MKFLKFALCLRMLTSLKYFSLVVIMYPLTVKQQQFFHTHLNRVNVAIYISNAILAAPISNWCFYQTLKSQSQLFPNKLFSEKEKVKLTEIIKINKKNHTHSYWIPKI